MADCTSSYLISKKGYYESFKKCDGQQFHQYQQNKQSPFTLTPWTQNKTMAYEVGYPGFGTKTWLG